LLFIFLLLAFSYCLALASLLAFALGLGSASAQGTFCSGSRFCHVGIKSQIWFWFQFFLNQDLSSVSSSGKTKIWVLVWFWFLEQVEDPIPVSNPIPKIRPGSSSCFTNWHQKLEKAVESNTSRI
jgi:hypothetical protein